MGCPFFYIRTCFFTKNPRRGVPGSMLAGFSEGLVYAYFSINRIILLFSFWTRLANPESFLETFL